MGEVSETNEVPAESKIVPKPAVHSNTIWYACAVSIGIGLLLHAAVWNWFPTSSAAHGSLLWGLLLGYFFGTIYAHTALTAAGVILLPFKATRRWLVSASWGLLLTISMGMIAFSNAPGASIWGILLGMMVTQWLMTMVSLLLVTKWFGLRSYHINQLHEEQQTASQLQFGIRHIMLLTTGIAIALGIGRVFAETFIKSWLSRDFLDFVIVTISASLCSLPLMFALLLPRYAKVTTGVVLTIFILFSLVEHQVFAFFGRPGGMWWVFLFINGFTMAWIILILGIVRYGGYRIGFRNRNQADIEWQHDGQ